jgi:hypothetical protein
MIDVSRSGNSPEAVNVCVEKQHKGTTPRDTLTANVYLRYLGFEQVGSIRSYQFDRIASDEGTKTFVVTADMALFLKYQVGIQEGPAVCLHALSAKLGVTPPPLLEYALTDDDMVGHLASRPLPVGKRARKAALNLTAKTASANRSSELG